MSDTHTTNFMVPEPAPTPKPAWGRRCSCGRQHNPLAWAQLPRVGNQPWVTRAGVAHPQVYLDLRNCPCGNTLSMPVAPFAAGTESCPVVPVADLRELGDELEDQYPRAWRYADGAWGLL